MLIIKLGDKLVLAPPQNPISGSATARGLNPPRHAGAPDTTRNELMHYSLISLINLQNTT